MAHDRATGVALNERAIESLEFIRTMVARSAPFTAVPGRGGVAMGAVAVVAAVVAHRAATDNYWLATWMGAAVVAAPIGFIAMQWKAIRHGIGLWSAAGRRFAQGFVPSLVAAAVLTIALTLSGRIDLLPAIWLLLYGSGILAGSSSSVPVLAWLGVAFMVLGTAAAFTAPEWRDYWLAGGFGALQIGFGAHIARNHGG